MTNDAENVFIYQLANDLSSFADCLFKSFGIYIWLFYFLITEL